VFWSSRKAAELSFRFENAYVHPTAELGSDVEIGPFTYIGPNCRVGDGSRLHNNVTLVANTILGESNEVFPGAVLGGIPQDKKYDGEASWLVLGDGNAIRECVTINSSTRLGGGVTKLGSRNLIMASCHIAHDCVLGDEVTMANNVLLGGHVHVESYATFGGLAAVHHFVTIGQHAFIGGMARVSQDVPPFLLVEGNPLRVWSINKVGLKRRSFSGEAIQALKQAHRLLYRGRLPRREALAQLEAREDRSAEVDALIAFLKRTDAGKQGRARQP
jgi:UDP-N-acetylglucosamine acyltransferase